MASCECAATARRLAKGQGVQGCDAEVFADIAIELGGKWYVQGSLVRPNPEDLKAQEAMDKYDRALNEAKKLGLTEDQVRTLKAGPPGTL